MEAEDIAKELTKAQKDAIMGRQRSRRRPTELEIARQGTASALRRLGILDDGPRLTALGLAVRRALENEASQKGAI